MDSDSRGPHSYQLACRWPQLLLPTLSLTTTWVSATTPWNYTAISSWTLHLSVCAPITLATTIACLCTSHRTWSCHGRFQQPLQTLQNPVVLGNHHTAVDVVDHSGLSQRDTIPLPLCSSAGTHPCTWCPVPQNRGSHMLQNVTNHWLQGLTLLKSIHKV